MKLKDGIIIDKVNDDYFLIDTGKIKPRFNGMLKLNKTCEYLISELKNNDLTIDDLVNKLMSKYEVSEANAKTDIEKIIESLKRNNLLQ